MAPVTAAGRSGAIRSPAAVVFDVRAYGAERQGGMDGSVVPGSGVTCFRFVLVPFFLFVLVFALFRLLGLAALVLRNAHVGEPVALGLGRAAFGARGRLLGRLTLGAPPVLVLLTFLAGLLP